MPSVFYIKYVEVRLLHEYYLDSDSNPEYFALNDATRTAILDAKLNNDQYNIWDDLTIEPTLETLVTMTNNHIRFIKSKSGFMLAIRVIADSNLNIPFVSISPNITFSFHIRTQNGYFSSFTNSRFSTNVPAKYYFTNADVDNALIYPSLSNPIADFQPGQFYEMGEVAVIGTSTMEALTRTNDNLPAHWRSIGSVGIVNESDRVLLPNKFTYSFEKESNSKQADFNLLTILGVVVKTISVTDLVRLNNVSLDFTQINNVDIPAGRYFLQVNGDNGYTKLLSVYLNNSLYKKNDFGVIDISNNEGALPFNLLDATGLLKATLPVLEIRFKSRITYWRYLANNGIKFKTTPKTSPYLSAQNGVLRSVLPLTMVAAPLEFKDINPIIPHVFLPNPAGQSLHIENDGMIYSDIYIAIIKDLIVEDV